MTNLVVSHNLSFMIAHGTILLFLTTHGNDLKRLKQIALVHKRTTVLDCDNCSLIDDICEIRAHQSCGRQCDGIQIDGLIHLDIF